MKCFLDGTIPSKGGTEDPRFLAYVSHTIEDDHFGCEYFSRYNTHTHIAMAIRLIWYANAKPVPGI